MEKTHDKESIGYGGSSTAGRIITVARCCIKHLGRTKTEQNWIDLQV